jgi:hypothetical protein
VRLATEPYPLRADQLRGLTVDVLGWLGWDSSADGGRAEGPERAGHVAQDTAMTVIPPGGKPMTLRLVPAVPGSGRGALDPETQTVLALECQDHQEAVARLLLDEIRGAVRRLAHPQDGQGKDT